MIPLDIRREMVDCEEGQMSLGSPCEHIEFTNLFTIILKSNIILP
ncbi:MAG: hypothetical protein PWR20_1873 [Bacteroidales bacterium]|nr:hypothetical protein [Bacteroidales bacterium]